MEDTIIPIDDEGDIVVDPSISSYSPQWSRPVRFIALAFAIVGAIYAVTLLSPISVLLTITFLFTFIMYKPARFFYKRTRIPWALGVLISYMIMLTIILFSVIVLVPRIGQEFNNLIGTVQTVVEDLQEYAADYDPTDAIFDVFGFDVDMNFILEPVVQLINLTAPRSDEDEGASTDDTGTPREETVEPGTRPTIILDQNILNQEFINSLLNLAGTVTSVITSFIGSILNLSLNVLLSLFLSFLVLLDFRNTRRAVVNRLSANYHREIAVLLRRIVDIWNGFLKGQVMLAVLIGVVTYVQLIVMGVPGAVLVSLITAVISIIPTIGGIIALIPMFLIPLLTGSTVFTDLSPLTFALLVMGVNLIITQIIWNVVAPAIMGDALNLPMPVIILGVFVGASVGGVLGAFLVAPVLSMMRTITEYVVSKISGQDPYPDETGEIASQWEIERMRRREKATGKETS